MTPEPRFQSFCVVMRYMAGGLTTPLWRFSCLAVVDQGRLKILDASLGTIDSAPLHHVQLDSTRLQRAVGVATLVRMNHHKWRIDFGWGAKDQAAQLQGGVKGTVRFFRLDRPLLPIARETNRRFQALLVEGGAKER